MMLTHHCYPAILSWFTENHNISLASINAIFEQNTAGSCDSANTQIRPSMPFPVDTTLNLSFVEASCPRTYFSPIRCCHAPATEQQGHEHSDCGKGAAEAPQSFHRCVPSGGSDGGGVSWRNSSSRARVVLNCSDVRSVASRRARTSVNS